MKDSFKLGFGLMRLPKLSDGSIDIEQVKEMADLFIQNGGTYFDTAYVYEGGKSEEAFKAAVADRYPRESYTLATKLMAKRANNEEEAKQQFYTSLERTGAGYFDYYLLHAVQDNNYTLYDDYHLWDFVKELKEKGLVKHWGFSFHSTPDLLEKLLTEHPDAEFVQLQINYADMENPNVRSREVYETARRFGKPVTVMEPVKGGGLADPNPAVQKILKEADPNASFASWAIRYVASLDGILTVLSGMSTLDQMKDNLSYMKDFKPLSEAEQEVIREAQKALLEGNEIACTACHYCTRGCPMSINIPEIFASYNEFQRYHNPIHLDRNYKTAVGTGGRASECLQCGQCEDMCPQSLPIIRLLEKVAETAE